MDTSETFIKMCERAGEIRKLTPEPDEKDWYSDNGSVWLPRQDQLQEMIGNYNAILEYWKKITWHWWHDEDGEFHNSNISIRPYLGKFTSMEQLWLAFCMSEKFNKVWNGESWIAKK